MHLKRLSVFIVLLSIYTIWRLPYDNFAQESIQSALSKLQNSGINASVQQVDLEFPLDLAYKNFTINIPAKPFPIPFNLESGSIKSKLLNILLFSLGVHHEGLAYGGKIDLDLSKSLFGSQNIDFNVSNLDLSKHEYLKIVGAKGQLSILSKLTLDGNFPEQGSISLKIDQGSLDSNAKLYGYIKLPALSELNLLAKGEIDAGNLKVSSCQLSSNLGTATCSGELMFSQQGQIDTANIRINIQLNDAGTIELAPYLALAAGIQSTGAESSWQVIVSKTANGYFNSKVALR